MSANYIYEPYIYTQITPVSTISIEHNFGRRVNVVVYDENDEKIYPKIEEILEPGDTYYNKITISFYERSQLIPKNNWTAIIS